MEAPAHFGDLFQGVLLPPGLGSVDGVVVERLAGQVHHLAEVETVRFRLRATPNGTRSTRNTPSSWEPPRDRAWCPPMRRQLRRGSPGWAAGSLGRSSTDSTADKKDKQQVSKPVMEKGFTG